MFSRLSRLPLRRCLHTRATAGASASNAWRATQVTLGASAVTAAYMTWRLTREGNQIALDSPQTLKHSKESSQTKSLQMASHPTDAPSELTASTSHSEQDVFVPDTPSSETQISAPDSDDESPKPDGEEPSGEGQGAAQGAFNPETGEINWDCPCLGGMAHGPCGPEFREAFSCFVFSEAEPKGINCVDKFQNMQNCFRAHPEVYADEIMDDDDEESPAPADSNVPPQEETSSDDKLNGTTTSGLSPTQKPHIDSAHVASGSP
ncbi:hypothetical protein GALMADRAFT_248524 [Galerina marginata CBS 339.88]|uniref:Mitochondrial intermembrane space import and assembly protein 40 n=1 Tax=Galerina marginata (strain CBS 339.88) TaxID=685588 RepID=A0A067SY36_GALM3|nr:hypothetical protein GALMADRAFT_248524 [Galerina marginata CBS 339.88]